MYQSRRFGSRAHSGEQSEIRGKQQDPEVVRDVKAMTFTSIKLHLTDFHHYRL
jgi:hypothetical protein